MSKIFRFQAIQFSQSLLVQTIQFSTSIVLVYTQLNVKIVLFKTIQPCVSTVSVSKTVLFKIIQFSISTQFSSIWPIDSTLSGATTPGQSGLGNDRNERVLRIYQCSSIIETSPSDCLVSYQDTIWGWGSYPSSEIQAVYLTAPADWATGHSLGGSYPSTEMQSVYSTSPADWAI